MLVKSNKNKKFAETTFLDKDKLKVKTQKLISQFTLKGRPVILDEFRDTQCSHEFFLKLTDKYTHRLGSKSYSSISK